MVVTIRYIIVALWYSICILSCIDTKHFVYTSLSHTLYPAISGSLMVVAYTLICLYKKRAPHFCIVQMMALLLASYISFHGLLIDAELYKQGYTICTLLLMVVLGGCVKDSIIDKRHVVIGIILISTINIAYLIAQFVGIMPSGNPFFRLTGSNENPNIAAMAITISIPFIIERIRKREYPILMTAIAVLITVFILTLKCRTAIVGVICIIICYVIVFSRSVKTEFIWKLRSRKTISVFLCICLIAFVAILAISGYNWKKDSADGRLFIWQRNCEMIANSPWGHGYGMYEVEYNKYQSHYFATHKREYGDSKLATACGSAYNDILEHGVQGGVIGTLLYLMFLLLPTYQAYRNHNWTCFIAMIAILAMSITNSICYSISPWIMTISVISIVGGSCKSSNDYKLINLTCIVVTLVMALFFLHREVVFTISQKQLKTYRNTEYQDVKKIKTLCRSIGTSEAYFKHLAECYENNDDYNAADICYTKARKYTAAPLLLYKSAMCKEKLGDRQSALKIMREAVYMLPNNFSLKYSLMMMYNRYDDKHHAKQIAKEIITTPVRRDNESIHFIRNEAAAMLEQQ